MKANMRKRQRYCWRDGFVVIVGVGHNDVLLPLYRKNKSEKGEVLRAKHQHNKSLCPLSFISNYITFPHLQSTNENTQLSWLQGQVLPTYTHSPNPTCSGKKKEELVQQKKKKESQGPK
jgi:hypothetical protein